MVEKKKDEPGPDFRVQTDGINFEGAFANDDLVDVTAVTCNDVGAVLRTFGVEAARRTVVAEVGGVFGAYGIGVDPRHLSLISDHMTRQVILCAPLQSAISPKRLLTVSKHVLCILTSPLQLAMLDWLAFGCPSHHICTAGAKATFPDR